MAKLLALGLGNELLADDGAGIAAARLLKPRLNGDADVIESSAAGLALMDLFIGYDRAVIIDAVRTGRRPPGSLYRWGLNDLGKVAAPSPHYAGLPEIIALADALELKFPSEIAVFAIEVKDTITMGAPLSSEVARALPELVDQVSDLLENWMKEDAALKLTG